MRPLVNSSRRMASLGTASLQRPRLAWQGSFYPGAGLLKAVACPCCPSVLVPFPAGTRYTSLHDG